MGRRRLLRKVRPIYQDHKSKPLESVTGHNLKREKTMNKDVIRMQQLISRETKYTTNHILHLLLSVFTFGFWVPVWLLVTVSNANERKKCQNELAKLGF